jgi:AraC family transcriptional regulator
LLESGMRLRDTPPFEEYLNTPLDTAPSELLTDIYIPLA